MKALAVNAWLLSLILLLHTPSMRGAAQQRTPRLTPAERAAALATLERVGRIIMQVPELAGPDGFEVVPHISFDGSPIPGDRSLITYRYTLVFYVPTQRVAAAVCECLTVTVNFSPVTSPGSQYYDARGREIYIEPPRSNAVPLATQVYDRLSPTDRSAVTVLFTARGEVPWLLVSREDFYRAVIFDAEGKDGGRIAAHRNALKTTPYKQWLADAPRRKQQRDQLLASLATTQSASELVQTRRALEANERQVGEDLKATEGRDRVANQKARGARYTDRIRAELASMSAAERRAPAFIDLTLNDGPFATGWRLAPAETATAWRVLTPKLEFWRAHGSRVAARGIAVRISVTGAGETPALHRALWQAYSKLDWRALRRLVEAGR